MGGVDKVEGGYGEEGSSLGAQACVAEADGQEAAVEGGCDFGGREVALGADEQGGVAVGKEGGGEGSAGQVGLAVGNQALALAAAGEPLGETDGGKDGG